MKNSLSHDLDRLLAKISSARKRDFVILLIFSLAVSFTEIVSIGAVIPFITALSMPEKVFEHQAARPLIEMLGLESADELLLPLSLAFAGAALIAGFMRIALTGLSIRLAFSVGAEVSVDIYGKTLRQPYVVHTSRNSSEVIAAITTKVNSVSYHVITPILNIVCALVMTIAIVGLLLNLSSAIVLAGLLGFGSLFVVIAVVTQRRRLANGYRIAELSSHLVKCLQEGLGGIRDIIVEGSHGVYQRQYRETDVKLRHAMGVNQFILQSPRFVVESVGMILIAAMAYTLTAGEAGAANAMPLLAAFALGAQKLIPLMQQIYASWSTLQGSRGNLADVIEFLEQTAEPTNITSVPLPFLDEIGLRDVTFKYCDTGRPVLNGVSLNICRGERIGLIGATGCGKSTLLDLIMGLLEPTSGVLEIDGVPLSGLNRAAWQKNIAHVPQAVFLADATIAENIAFGIDAEDIDMDRVEEAATQAQLSDSIESWPERYSTMVGERGVRLSGGQRQRIGIARALYKRASLILLDEATSALDSATEDRVMSFIDTLDQTVTVIMIAHRLTTLKSCSRIFEFEDGTVLRTMTYSQLDTALDLSSS